MGLGGSLPKCCGESNADGVMGYTSDGFAALSLRWDRGGLGGTVIRRVLDCEENSSVGEGSSSVVSSSSPAGGKLAG